MDFLGVTMVFSTGTVTVALWPWMSLLTLQRHSVRSIGILGSSALQSMFLQISHLGTVFIVWPVLDCFLPLDLSKVCL